MYSGSATGAANFQDLMSMAKQNAAEAKKRAANAHMFPETGKKRADPKQVKLKEGVAKFLAKRDEEERRQKELDRQKKDKLLQLRNQDRKATNRVRKMLSMTKSANKSCMDDSKDCLNDSVTAQAQGDFQPDEDDYGYTSKFADEMHRKMMEKYKAMPVKPAFPQSRVPVPTPQSLTSRNGTGWRKPKADYEPEGDASPEQSHHEDIAPPKKKPERLKKVPNKPPPPDYHQLLQLAQEKAQQPPPAIPVVDKKGGERDEFEFGRPMTAKEKASHLALKDLRERAARKYSDKNNNNSSGSSSAVDNRNVKPTVSFKIPKANKSRVEEERIELPPPPPPPPKKAKHATEPVRASTSEASVKPRQNEHVSNGRSSSLSKSSSLPSKANGSKSSSSPTSSRPNERVRQGSHLSPHSTPTQSSSRPRERESSVSQKSNGHSSKPEPMKKPEKIPQERLELIKEKPRYLSAFEGRKETNRDPDADRPRKQPPPSNDSRKAVKPSTSRDMPSQSRSNEGRDRGREERGRDERYREERVRDERGRDGRGREERGAPDRRYDQRPVQRDRDRDRDRLPPPQRRDIPRSRTPPRMRDEPPPRMKPKFKGRAVIDSDEEYDSEMDDFIDDSEADLPNISAEISRIFKYDRRRFHDEESDDECMESSVAEQLREESRSLRIGIQEDMEDIRREEEEKRRMMLMKKKARR